MTLTQKHRKILFLSGLSAVLILLGMAVGSWAVDKIAGDPAVLNDIDKHFQNLDEKLPQNSEAPTPPPASDTPLIEAADHGRSPQTVPDSAKKAKRPLKSKKNRKVAGQPPPPQNPWPGLTEVAPATYSIHPKLMNAAKTNPKPFIQGVRAVLAEKDGAPLGFRILGIRPNSALFALGLRHGDVLTSVNGHNLGSVDEALLAAAALKASTRFRVDIFRAGRPLSLYYRVEGTS